MDKEKNQKPFSDVLDSLFGDETIHISDLYRLTDLSEEEMLLFTQRWPAVDDIRRQQIARHLADLVEDNFMVDFSSLFKHFLSDNYGSVRQAALDGLWDSTDLNLVMPIINLLQNDPEMDVRASAAAALAHFLLMSHWDELPEYIEPPIVAALESAYNNAEATIPLKRAALEALAPVNSNKVRLMIRDAYESDSFEMQLSAVFAMGNSAEPRWLSIVLDEMQNPRWEMRGEAARAAGNIGHEDAIPDLAEMVADEEEDVALAAIAALGEVGGVEVAQILEDLLLDPELAEFHDAIEEAMEQSYWLTAINDPFNDLNDNWQDELE